MFMPQVKRSSPEGCDRPSKLAAALAALSTLVQSRSPYGLAQGRFDSPVTLTRQRRDELGHLGEQINRMAENGLRYAGGIEACRWTVACRNREPSGLEVTISLEARE